MELASLGGGKTLHGKDEGFVFHTVREQLESWFIVYSWYGCFLVSMSYLLILLAPNLFFFFSGTLEVIILGGRHKKGGYQLGKL